MNRFDNVYAFSRGPSQRAVAARVAPRQALWDLADACRCPLLGVCFGAERLREVVNAVFDGESGLCDFELHAGVVRECASRNKVSQALQADLDERFAGSVHSLDDVREPVLLAQRWLAASQTPEVAAMFWAVLSHPGCDAVLTERLLRDMHLMQHRAVHDAHVHLEASRRAATQNHRLREALAERSLQCEQLRLALAERAAAKPSVWQRFAFAGPRRRPPREGPPS